MSILKKIGQIVNAASMFVPIYGNLIRAVVATIPSDRAAKAVDTAIAATTDGLVLATKIVLDAEVMGQAINAPGAQKAAMLAPAMYQLLIDLPVLQGKKPKNADSARAKAGALGGALADFFNEFED